jgi:hypothetical protein
MQPWWRSSFVLGVVVATGALSSSAFASSTALPVGPGPRTPYVVQSQPAPGHCHYRHTHSGQPLPDIRCTPGSTNPRVTQSNLHRTICKSGYSSSIRPPESVTAVEKKANARSYAYKGSLTQTEYDHLVSLELGGDPNDPRNLWVEPPSPGHRLSQTFRNPKDTVENEAHALICSGAVRLVPMQRAMAKDWTTALAVVGALGRIRWHGRDRSAQGYAVQFFELHRPASQISSRRRPGRSSRPHVGLVTRDELHS